MKKIAFYCDKCGEREEISENAVPTKIKIERIDLRCHSLLVQHLCLKCDNDLVSRIKEVVAKWMEEIKDGRIKL